MCLPSFTAITLHTQVKNNLSWLLGGFARKYWAISIKLCASCLGEEIWHLKRREEWHRNDNLKSNFPSSSLFCLWKIKAILRIQKGDWWRMELVRFQRNWSLHVKEAFHQFYTWGSVDFSQGILFRVGVCSKWTSLTHRPTTLESKTVPQLFQMITLEYRVKNARH